ncbi:MAG: hypothetical protein HYW70_01910 [Candidatus Nealsonbacteria bacterium]|nr:hypothetical protein [Candidatus Nealsonbacteria bacterium]
MVRVNGWKGNFLRVGRAGYKNPVIGGELAPKPQEIVKCDWYPIGVIGRNTLPFYNSHRKIALKLLELISDQRLTTLEIQKQ